MGAAAEHRGNESIRASVARDFAGRGYSSLAGSVNHPAPETMIATPKPFAIGETVYCKVRQLRGRKETVTAVKGAQIKVAGCAFWCPASNFQREQFA